ncbi:NSs protein [Rice dwarf-associated bunya-like virus]|uniref:NSs protein n=1 Tax=Rice dwarf-associated bunya-like virus TaxID=2963305 RepID=A0AAE9MQT9_9VIRU|nr:NSs protein [Rice dwarf-associated bunya-like virus]
MKLINSYSGSVLSLVITFSSSFTPAPVITAFHVSISLPLNFITPLGFPSTSWNFPLEIPRTLPAESPTWDCFLLVPSFALVSCAVPLEDMIGNLPLLVNDFLLEELELDEELVLL